MTSLFGALWTGLQGIGWLVCFLHQLITDTFNFNYRLVNGVGYLVVGVAKLLYMLFSGVTLAVYEVVSYVLLTVAGICSFVIDCLGFVAHCLCLLSKLIYYTVTGLADGVFFVVLMPVCACQTVHEWITWIFNTQRWLNASAWCFRTCGNALSVIGESSWNLILSLATTVNYWLFTFTTFICEKTVLLSCYVYNGCLFLSNYLIENIVLVLFRIWSLIALSIYCIYDCFLMLLENLVSGLFELTGATYFCLIPISISVLTMLFHHRNRLARLLPRFLWHSTGEVIRINLDDVDLVEVSDDEEDQDFANDEFLDDENEDLEAEDTDDEESVMAESSDEQSDEMSVVNDSDIDDSDAETIDVQLPDRPAASRPDGRQHGYATRSKGNVSHLQQRLDHERERSLCVICQDQMKSVLVLPCRHMCMCVDCARTVVSGAHGQRRICPLCRANIRIVMNVYT